MPHHSSSWPYGIIAPTPIAPKARCLLSIPALLVCFIVNIVWLGNEPARSAIVPASKMGIAIDSKAIFEDKNSYEVEVHVWAVILGNVFIKKPLPNSSRPHLVLKHYTCVGINEGTNVRPIFVIRLLHRQLASTPIWPTPNFRIVTVSCPKLTTHASPLIFSPGIKVLILLLSGRQMATFLI